MDFDTRPAAYAVIIRDGQVLLAHYQTSVASEWTLPGGGLEIGESPVQCCVREVAEETGYQIRVLGTPHVGHLWIDAAERVSPREGRPLCAIQLVYRAEIIGGQFAVEVGGSTDDAAWVDLADLDDYAGPGGWPVTMVRQVLAG